MSGVPVHDAPLVLTPRSAAALFSLMDCPVPPIVLERLSVADPEGLAPDPAQVEQELARAGLIVTGESSAVLTATAAEMMAVITEATVAITIASAFASDPVTAFLLEERTAILGAEDGFLTFRMLPGDEERERWLAATLGASTPCPDARLFRLDTPPDQLERALEAGARGDGEIAAAEWERLGAPPDLSAAFVDASASLSDWAAVTAISTRSGDVSTTRVGMSPHGAWLARVCLQDEEYRAQLVWLPARTVLDVLKGTWTLTLSA